MAHDPFTPLRKDQAEQIREKLKDLRERDPANYARGSTRMIRELERLSRTKHRYAKT